MTTVTFQNARAPRVFNSMSPRPSPAKGPILTFASHLGAPLRMSEKDVFIDPGGAWI
jgi:hypothetical protein